MAPVGIAERVRIVLKNVDFPGQTFFPQSFFSCRQAGFKQSLTGFIVDDEIENVVALGGGILRMAAGVLIKPSTIDEEGIGGPAVWNETFKNIPQHLLHRQIDASVRRKNETVLILQTEDSPSQGAGLQHAVETEYQPTPPSSTEGHDPPMKRREPATRHCLVLTSVQRVSSLLAQPKGPFSQGSV